MIKEIEEFARRSHKEIEEAVATPPNPGERRVLKFELTLTAPDTTEFDKEMDELQKLL